jgi:hypothetical protein
MNDIDVSRAILMEKFLTEKKSFQIGLKPYAKSDKHLFHFSDIDKVGVNPRYRYSTPLGVYGYLASEIYPKIEKDQPYFGWNRKYCHVLEILSNKVLYLQQFKFDSKGNRIARKLYDDYLSESYPNLSYDQFMTRLRKTSDPEYPVKSDGDLFWKLLYSIVEPHQIKIARDPVDIPIKKSTIMMNTILRDLGYEVIIDDGGTIHKMQTTQGILLTKSSYRQVTTIEQFGK